ncbi:MAG: DUF6458 family protein [Frankia sp.]
MTIGAGIFLMAVGAILAFAVHVSLSGLNIAVIGVILMIAGAIGIALDLTVFAPRRRASIGNARIGPTGGLYGEGPLGETVTVEDVPSGDVPIADVPSEYIPVERVPVSDVYREEPVLAPRERRYRRRTRSTARTEEYPPRTP